MVGTIIPMVYGKYTPSRKLPGLLIVHTLASAAGGLSAGFALGYISRYLAPRWDSSLLFFGAIVGSVAIASSLKEAALVNVRLPESRWQVPREWAATKSDAAAACLYGFFLGVGLLTRMSNCFYPVLVWSVLQGRPERCILVMFIFGICRTIPMWVIYLTSESHDTEYSRLSIYSLGQWQPAARLFSAFGLVFVGSLFAMAWLPYRIG